MVREDSLVAHAYDVRRYDTPHAMILMLLYSMGPCLGLGHVSLLHLLYVYQKARMYGRHSAGRPNQVQNEEVHCRQWHYSHAVCGFSVVYVCMCVYLCAHA